MSDNTILRQSGLVTLATAIGAIGLGYYAYKYFRPTYATLPTAAGVVGGAVVGGYAAGTLAGIVLR
jgi:hypothetical protein